MSRCCSSNSGCSRYVLVLVLCYYGYVHITSLNAQFWVFFFEIWFSYVDGAPPDEVSCACWKWLKWTISGSPVNIIGVQNSNWNVSHVWHRSHVKTVWVGLFTSSWNNLMWVTWDLGLFSMWCEHSLTANGCNDCSYYSGNCNMVWENMLTV